MPHKQISSYLRSLKFDPKLWNTIQAKYLVNFRLVALFIVAIILFGISNYLSIPRRQNPEVKIPIVTVFTSLTGATPRDVESLVTIPLEDKLNGVKGLDTITSASNQGASSITMQFLSSVDVEKARADVQSIVDTVPLPTEAKLPVVNSVDFEHQPIWDFIITGKTDLPSLMKFSKILKDRIKNVKKVDSVTLSGYDNREIDVVIDNNKLREYNISPAQLSQLLSRSTHAYPAGSINTNNSTLSLSIDQEITTIDDIRELHVGVQGKIIKLSDIATVQEKSKSHQAQNFFSRKNSYTQPAVEFFVYKTSSANIDAAEKDVKKVVEDTIKEYNNQFEVVTVTNAAEEIVKQFSDLVSEFRSTIILVFINLLLFLGLRQAFISSMTIPLTFLSALSIINALGLTLNFLTLFAFLIALGLLIDDTIVTVAAMTRYYSTGKFTSQETGLLVWRDFIVPLWSTTITTIWAFIPLLLATGIIGAFIKPIPIVVTATLLSSTTIAVFITLPLMMIVLKPQIPYRVKIFFRIVALIIAAAFIYFLLPKSSILPLLILVVAIFAYITYQVRPALWERIKLFLSKYKWTTPLAQKTRHIIDHGLINTESLSYRYMNLIDRILGSPSARRKTIFALIVFAVVAYMLVPFGFVVSEFFPKSDQDVIYMNVQMPAGTSIETTTNEALVLLSKVKNTKGVQFVAAGTGGGAGGSGFGGNTNGQNLFNVTLHLFPKKDRQQDSIQIADQLRKKYVNYSKGTLSVQELSGGPPAGVDVQIKLSGDNQNTLDQYANKVIAFLKSQPGITNVDKSIKSGTSRLIFVPDKLKLAENGLTADSISTWLKTYAAGFNLNTLKVDNTDTDIILKMDTEAMTPESLASISVPVTNTGTNGPTTIPLLSLGEIKLDTNPTTITREGGKRTISVSASVTKGYPIPAKNKDLETFANTKLNLVNGYSWSTGGANEQNQKSIQSIFQAMILSFLLILVTMVIEFRSFRQALMVMLVIPLAIPGVFYVFALTGTPLSFPALIGLLALFGIVVTNAIVVVEKINDNRKEGLPLREAIVDAAGSRLEPILLTSVTSILGLIPITISNPLWRGLGGAIISGLLFSGIIKLFFVPIVYYTWYKNDELTERKEVEKKDIRHV